MQATKKPAPRLLILKNQRDEGLKFFPEKTEKPSP
jgi:hypothetical protein